MDFTGQFTNGCWWMSNLEPPQDVPFEQFDLENQIRNGVMPDDVPFNGISPSVEKQNEYIEKIRTEYSRIKNEYEYEQYLTSKQQQEHEN